MTTCRITSTPTASLSIPLSTRAIRRSVALRARPSPSRAPIRAAAVGRVWRRRSAGCTRREADVTTLVLTAHGSADPRAAQTTFAVADRIRRLRPGLDVRSAFCEQTSPNLRDVLADVDDDAVVTPL